MAPKEIPAGYHLGSRVPYALSAAFSLILSSIMILYILVTHGSIRSF
jgi:hypothetical protein